MGVFLFENSPVIFCGICNYNDYMRKIKIFITVLILYEFVISTILQISGFCNTFFNRGFCDAGSFKYFLMCVMVPGLLILFFWWLPEILRTCCRNKCQCNEIHTETKPIQKETSEIISREDMERLVTSAIVIGIQKFAAMHPKTTKAFNNIVDVLKNTKTIKKNK